MRLGRGEGLEWGCRDGGEELTVVVGGAPRSPLHLGSAGGPTGA